MSFLGLMEWMQDWRSSDCWQQTVPCPGSSDDHLVGGTTSAGELGDLRCCLGSIRETCWRWLDR